MQSGDACPNPKCKGRLRVRTSKRISDSYEQRLECNTCQRECGKYYVPADQVWPRKQFVYKPS